MNILGSYYYYIVTHYAARNIPCIYHFAASFPLFIVKFILFSAFGHLLYFPLFYFIYWLANNLLPALFSFSFSFVYSKVFVPDSMAQRPWNISFCETGTLVCNIVPKMDNILYLAQKWQALQWKWFIIKKN